MSGELILYAVCRAIVVAFCRVFWRVSIEGRENVPASEPFVLAPVHRSNVDSLVVSGVTRRRMRYMGKHTMWKYRLPGRFFTALGGFPVHRGTADREALRTCIEILQTGEPIVVFPEGTRQSGPAVQPLFEGAAYIASKAGVPIIPVGIGGSEGAMPKGSKLIRPVKIHLVVGEPVRVKGAGEGGRVPRSALRDATDALHVSLQRLFDRANAAAAG